MAVDRNCTCGKTTVGVSGFCSFVCECDEDDSCNWQIDCPSPLGHGLLYTVAWGTGRELPEGGGHPHEPGVTVNGPLGAIAHALSRLWDRPVICPPDLADKNVNETLKGISREEIARALGLGFPKAKA